MGNSSSDSNSSGCLSRAPAHSQALSQLIGHPPPPPLPPLQRTRGQWAGTLQKPSDPRDCLGGKEVLDGGGRPLMAPEGTMSREPGQLPASWNIPCLLGLCQPSARWGCRCQPPGGQVAEARSSVLGFFWE